MVSCKFIDEIAWLKCDLVLPTILYLSFCTSFCFIMPVKCSSDTCPVPACLCADVCDYCITLSAVYLCFFCRMSMKELLESKHPTAWSEFEKGLIDEVSSRCLTYYSDIDVSYLYVSYVC
jgi:hypothetical protein